MRTVAATAAALLTLASSAAAGTVKIPIHKQGPGSAVSRHPLLTKRATALEILANNITGGGYYASVSVGTPGQNISLVLDTGSSDAFVVDVNADLCTSARLQAYYGTTCDATFDSSDSSTYKVVEANGFSIEYLDGSSASGDFVTDTFEIADVKLDDFQFGLADSTVTGTGVLGIGFAAEEVAASTYSNLPAALVKQGAIPVNAYSLYLNEYSSDTGSILFGGVDTEKFIGELTVLPILENALGSSSNFSSFTIAMVQLDAVFSNGTDPANITLPDTLPAILDSGTTLTYLPNDVATSLFEAVNAYTYTEGDEGLTLVDCKYLDSDDELSMNFGFASSLSSSKSEVTISVKAAELVLDVYAGYQSQLPSEIPFDEVCLFGIQNSGTGLPDSEAQSIEFALLGDTFLRNAYVVYHLTNREIGIAQANLGSTGSDIKELSASVSPLPVYTGVASQQPTSTVTTTKGSGSSGGGSSTATQSGMVVVTVTSSPTASNNAAVSNTRPPTGEAFAVMAVAGVFSLVGGVLFVL